MDPQVGNGTGPCPITPLSPPVRPGRGAAPADAGKDSMVERPPQGGRSVVRIHPGSNPA